MPSCPFTTRRWRNTQTIKTCVCVLLVLFLVSCVRLYHSESEPSDGTNKPTSASTFDLSTVARTSEPSQTTVVQTAQPSLQAFSPILNADDATNSVLELQKTIAQLNELEQVFNAERYTDFSSTEGLVIIVQVHNRIGYVRQLIESFKRAKDVDKIILIFSHDYYSKPINDLIKSISFCKVRLRYFIFTF